LGPISVVQPARSAATEARESREEVFIESLITKEKGKMKNEKQIGIPIFR
jgi:hypothetical protein